MADDLEGCTVTFAALRDRLELLECKLAEKYELRGAVRRLLIERDKSGNLDESDLVEDWREAYSSFLDWLEWARSQSPPTKPMKPPPVDSAQKAVQAAAVQEYRQRQKGGG